MKKQVEETNSKEEAKEVIGNTDMELTDDELDCITGGNGFDGSETQRPKISVDPGNSFDNLILLDNHKFEYKDGKFHML